MKIEVTSEELQLVLDSLDYRENYYAYSGAEVLPELNALNNLYNRLSEIQEKGTPEQELERRIESLDEVISVHASERSAELRNDPTIDQERIEDIVRIEMHELRRERDQLYNQLRALNVEFGLGQEISLEH